MTHAECVIKAAGWLDTKCDIVLPEFFTHNSELADVIGFKNGGKSIVIECKVSRGDFLGDKKKPFRWPQDPARGMGDERYYCCPAGMIRLDELPTGWGLIYIYPSGFAKQVKKAAWLPKNVGAEHHLLFYYARRSVFAGTHNAVMAYRSGL